MRVFPENLTETNYEAIQVRIVRDGTEFSKSFSFSKSKNKSKAISDAVAWRDSIKKILPPAIRSESGYLKRPQSNKRSVNRPGITRYITKDKRRIGNPSYLVYGVNYTDKNGQSKVKSFQVGKLDTFNHSDELHAAMTAEAFRSEWEWCKDHKKEFNDQKYKGWKKDTKYPFTPEERSTTNRAKSV